LYQSGWKEDSIFSADVFSGVLEEGALEKVFLERGDGDIRGMHAGESGMDQDAPPRLPEHHRQCILSLD